LRDAAQSCLNNGGDFTLETFSGEIFRQTGAEFRSVRVDVNDDGAVRVSAQDMGQTAKQAFGSREYEFWVDVPATAQNKLLFALLRDKYRDRVEAVDEFRDFCKTEAVEHKWGSWT
jgi:hypothetical protein